MATEQTSSKRVPVGSLCLAVAVFGAVGFAAGVVHELVHLLIHFLETGTLRSCGFLGPLTLSHNRLAVCLSGGISPWNALMTPATVSALGLITMWASAVPDTEGVRWGLFAGGAVVWLREALYSAGWFMPPTVSARVVEYWGDGRTALRAFGPVAQLPGFLLLVAGAGLLYKRLSYRRGSEADDTDE